MYGFSLVWLLVLILFFALFRSINKLQNGEQNLGRNVYYWYFIYTYPKFIFINPRLLMTVGEDSVQYRKRKKALLLSSSHFVFLSVKLL